MVKSSSNALWVKRSKPKPQARLGLFCFPHAGGGASIFRKWADHVPDQVEVCAVQLPGREDRIAETPFTRMSPLIESLAHALDPYLQEKPYVFFGHSMGAFVSFELARYLRKYHHTNPLKLFVASQRAPQIPDTEPPVYDLPDKEFIEELRHLNGTPVAVLQNAEVLELTLPVLRADFALCETYQYIVEDPLHCSISTFGGLYDEKISRNNLEAWREQTRTSFTLRMFPGDHFFFNGRQAELLHTISYELMPFLRDPPPQHYG